MLIFCRRQLTVPQSVLFAVLLRKERKRHSAVYIFLIVLAREYQTSQYSAGNIPTDIIAHGADMADVGRVALWGRSCTSGAHPTNKMEHVLGQRIS